MTARTNPTPGTRYGHWTLLEAAGFTARREQQWKVRCSCGRMSIKILSKIVSGQSRSCGCTRSARHQEVLQHLSGKAGA